MTSQVHRAGEKEYCHSNPDQSYSKSDVLHCSTAEHQLGFGQDPDPRVLEHNEKAQEQP